MSITVEGIFDVESLVARISVEAPRRVMATMNKNAMLVAATARKMAPELDGNLEDSIMVSPASQGRDEAGRFVVASADVYLDLDHAAKHGGTVGQYAYIMHEYLTPAGDMQLGDQSQLKQAQVDVEVGGWFLYRALEHYADIIYHDAVLAAEEGY